MALLLLCACGPGERKVAAPAPPQDAPAPTCGHAGEPEPPNMAGMTAAHNAVRCQIEGLPPLAWSAELASVAQAYAGQLAKSCDLQHSQTEHGENLLAGTGNYRPADVVERWAGEKRCFHHDTFPACCQCTCGHYTQLVWRDTRRVGCGAASCADGTEIWVCNYDPAGNYTGTVPY